MSHRTQDLPAKHGFERMLRELRYHEGARQWLAVILILVYAVTARPIDLLAWIGLPLAALGTAIRVYASGFIMKNEQLATHGPYGFVRHPLYTGNILIVFGLSLANSQWWAGPLAVLFFWFYYPTAIEYEDRKLRRLFGESWQRWAQRTPALIPAFGNRRDLAAGTWSFAKSARRNGELVIAVFIVLCMAAIIWQLEN
jgi:protein-S-isoprenylcysteine O-methyltransferase Ste14